MPSRKIEDCEQKLRDAWPLMKADFEKQYKGWTLRLDFTHREPEFQFELYKKGRKKLDSGYWEVVDQSKVVTNCDGFKKLSNHNHYPSKAFDVCIQTPAKDFTWDTKLPQWHYLGDLALRYDLTWGGNWTKLVDMPHFEV